jgi:hypothetical protein
VRSVSCQPACGHGAMWLASSSYSRGECVCGRQPPPPMPRQARGPSSPRGCPHPRSPKTVERAKSDLILASQRPPFVHLLANSTKLFSWQSLPLGLRQAPPPVICFSMGKERKKASLDPFALFNSLWSSVMSRKAAVPAGTSSPPGPGSQWFPVHCVCVSV